MAALSIKLSVIIPTFQEGERLLTLLQSLQQLRGRGVELVVVDGSGHDSSLPGLAELCDVYAVSSAGRGIQMNRGASLCGGDWLLFMHVDSDNAPACVEQLTQYLRAVPHSLAPESACDRWGFFRVAIAPERLLLRCIAAFMNLRSRVTGIATGDQGLWVSRKLFEQCGGYTEPFLMEDIALCSALRQRVKPLQLTGPLVTDGRRWLAKGIVATVCQMWWLRFRYWMGTPASELALQYYPGRFLPDAESD